MYVEAWLCQSTKLHGVTSQKTRFHTQCHENLKSYILFSFVPVPFHSRKNIFLLDLIYVIFMLFVFRAVAFYTQAFICNWSHKKLMYHIHSNARWGFSLKFGAYTCEVLNSCMKDWSTSCQTGSLWTAPCGAKSRPASQNHHVQMREQVMTKIYWLSLSSPPFWGGKGGLCSLTNFFKEAEHFRTQLVPCSGKEAPNLLGPFSKLFSVTWHCRNMKLVKVCI